MKKYATLMLILTGCTEIPRPEFKNTPIPMKICLDNCITHVFHNFHSKGDSLGTGSSSMSGLSQSQIFDRVEKYCKDFYQDEKCCEGSIHLNWKNIQTIHGYKYGACNG